MILIIKNSLNCCKSFFTNTVKPSFIEFAMTLIISTVPITIGAFFNCLNDGKVVLNFSNYFLQINNLLQHGELYLYSASFLAPIIFLTTYDKEGKRNNFPFRSFFITIIILLFLIISHSFGSQAEIPVKVPVEEVEKSLFDFSFYIFLFTSILYFIILLISNRKEETPTDIMKNNSTKMVEQYKERRRESTHE